MLIIGKIGRIIGAILMVPGMVVFGVSNWLVERSAARRPAKGAGRAAHRAAVSPAPRPATESWTSGGA